MHPEKKRIMKKKKHGPSYFFSYVAIINARAHAAGSSHTSQWANKEGVAHPPKVPIVGYTWRERRKVAIFFGWDFPIQNTDGTGIVLRLCIVRLFCVCVLLFLVKDFHSLMSFLFSVLPLYTRTHSLFLSNKYPLISFFLAVHRGVSICFVIHCIYGSEESSKEKLRLISSYSYSVCV